MLDVSKVDFQTATNSMRATNSSVVPRIDTVDDPGNSEAIIINSIIQMLTNKTNLVECSDSTAENVMKAARQIAKSLMHTVDTKLIGTMSDTAKRAYVHDQLTFAVKEYLSKNKTTYTATMTTFVDNMVFQFDSFALSLITMVFQDALDKVNEIQSAIINVPEKTAIDDANTFTAQIQGFKRAHLKLLDIIAKSDELNKVLTTQITTLAKSEKDLLAATDDKVNLPEQPASIGNTATNIKKAEASSVTTTAISAATSSNVPTVKRHKLLPKIYTTEPKWLTTIVKQIDAVNVVSNKISKISTKLKVPVAYRGRAAVASLSTPTTAKLMAGTGIGSFAGWLLALGAIFAVMSTFSDNWKIAAGRTLLTLPWAVAMKKRVAAVLKKHFSVSRIPAIARITRALTIRTRMFLRGNKIWEAFRQTKVAARLFPRLVGRSGAAAAGKVGMGVGSKFLGIAGSALVAYGEATEDPTEWAAKAAGLSVADYKKHLDLNVAARTANIIAGGDRGFLNALFNGLKWMPVGYPFLPLGPPIMFAAGILLNLIGRDNFVKVYTTLKRLTSDAVVVIKKLVMAPAKIIANALLKVTTWTGGVWAKYRTKQILVTSVYKIANIISSTTAKFTAMYMPLFNVLDQLKLANVKFKRVLTTDSDSLYAAMIQTVKLRLTTEISAPLVEYHDSMNTKLDNINKTTSQVLAAIKEVEVRKTKHASEAATDLSDIAFKLSTFKDTIGNLANYIGVENSVVTPSSSITALHITQQKRPTSVEPAAAFAKKMQLLYS